MFKIRKKLNNQHVRDEFVVSALTSLPAGSSILDAGCGSQRYRQYCSHLDYRSQDFGQYQVDEKRMLGTDGVGGSDGYQYGKLDYVGDIWSIDEKDQTFDTIMCTEVFEHIPFPIETVKEFSRLLKPGGKLILTAPSNCLRHMDPFFFYSGFSDRWYELILPMNGFKLESISPIGDYYSWISVEIARVVRNSKYLTLPILLPAFIYFFLKKPSNSSVDTLCQGYHVLATRV